MLRNKINQGAIGGILNRRRRDADLDHTVMHSGNLCLGGTRLYVDLEANGLHVIAILPELPKIAPNPLSTAKRSA
jgi:hypothetical protein